MPPTLATLVQNSALRLSVLAGHDRLDASVRWAHASELADPTPYMDGGELILFTGLKLDAADPEVMRAYVGKLVGKGVVGLGFAAGVNYEGVPQALIDACAAADLPLLEVPRRTPFIAISKAVSADIAAEQYRAVTAGFDAQREMTRAALSREGPSALLARLASQVDGWAALYDASGTVVATAPAWAVRRAARFVGDAERLRDRPAPASAVVSEADSGDDRVELQSIGTGRRAKAVLAVGTAAPLGTAERYAVNSAIALLTLTTERSRALQEAEQRLGAAVMKMLLVGEGDHARAVAGQLYGGLLDAPMRVIVAEPASAAAARYAHESITAQSGAARAGFPAQPGTPAVPARFASSGPTGYLARAGEPCGLTDLAVSPGGRSATAATSASGRAQTGKAQGGKSQSGKASAGKPVAGRPFGAKPAAGKASAARLSATAHVSSTTGSTTGSATGQGPATGHGLPAGPGPTTGQGPVPGSSTSSGAVAEGPRPAVPKPSTAVSLPAPAPASAASGVVVGPAGGPQQDAGDGGRLDRIVWPLEELADAVETAAARSGEAVLVVPDGARLVVLASDGGAAVAACAEFAATAPSAQPGRRPEGSAEEGLAIGVSAPAGLPAAAVAFKQADQALSVARRRGVPLVEHEDVAAGSVLPLLADDAVRAFADGLLRSLREHDANGRGDLVASLRAWLSRHGQWDAAAAELGVHRHTLRYRMRRVEEILGRSLDDPDVRMELWLALKATS
ncbi:PucR family transcriptional regulator ligand-binding domain-containing protein [Streptomyces albus]|uniref:PucR family transcriptional regulator ligand-binding domain-containing protein n=1 Tax=Streptomyces albus TaxID=1888 RepID=UPI0024AE64D8|nr:PucR family transcriptional regulator ligand-binding domain-containing protein [Streptomyces albus]MDI6409569.1 PucR family transcriptional regulator ligand-binding domain-containing protein [Streptomyces albus]